MSAYFLTISNPIPERSVSSAATKVLPVPTKGSITISPFLVKKETNSLTRDSGKEAGCRIFWSPLGSGLWTNHDFVNLIQSLPDSSLSLFWRVPDFPFSTYDTLDSTVETNAVSCIFKCRLSLLLSRHLQSIFH